jgi:release factor glutamine methyltransferase
MKQVPEILGRTGYLPFYLYFGDGNLRVRDWTIAARRLNDPLESLVNLFLLQKPVRRRAVEELLGDGIIDELKAAEILRNGGADLASNSFSLLSFRSNVYFAQLNDNPYAYFGEDSVALATYQTPVPGGEILDLCSGPGIQALIAARSARHVTGVEINPKASKVARVNQKMNEPGSRVEFINMSLTDFASANTRRYDRILFNPPLVPVPADMNYPFVGHGGIDGLSVTDEILGLYKNALKLNGRFEFIGMTVGKKSGSIENDPLIALSKKHRMEGTVHVLSRHKITEENPVVASCAVTLAHNNKMEVADARKNLVRYFRDSEYEYFYLFFCSWGNAARRRGKTSVVDMSYYYFGDWFA